MSAFIAKLFLLFCVVVAVSAKTLTGAIVSSQFICVEQPCGDNWKLAITRTNTVDQIGVELNTVLQDLLPGAPPSARDFQTFTTYDEATRSFFVAAPDYPVQGSATFWVSTINNDITVSTPVHSEVVIKYADSTSPFPLNVAPLKLARLISANGVLHATFTNGEIHQVDVANKSTKKLASIISDSQMLDVNFPQLSWAQVYDPSINGIWSVVTAGSRAYLSKVTLADLQVASWIELNNVDLMMADVKFSPETFINAHMVKSDPNLPPRLVVTMESLPSVGFDEMVFVDTTTGVMTSLNANLMSDNILLECVPHECDMWQVSTYDPVQNKMFFQGHLLVGDDFQLVQFYVAFVENRITGKWFPVIDPALDPAPYGYSGFQYVQIVN